MCWLASASSTALVLDFVEQPHVFDGNDGLVGEGREQLDLLVGKRCDLRLPQANGAKRQAVAQQWHYHHGAKPAQLLGFRKVIFRVRLHVWNLHRTPLQQRATDRGAPTCAQRMALPELEGARWGIVGCGGTAGFSIVAENDAVLGAANMRRILQQGLKDALEIERRSADGLEHLGGRGLLL